MSAGCKLLRRKCHLSNFPGLSRDQSPIPCPFSSSHFIILLLHSKPLWTKHTRMRHANSVYKLLKLTPAKLKPLCDINNSTEKESLVCTQVCLATLSSHKLSQGGLAQVQQVVYF